ncbi:hypothetical protein DXV76_04180 [Rhodobacteraceae bacterium CCMM004]|nr:hypothetical protein DXV76_04180 [Rhodobacteraceae bacterium CCMM004]
MTDLNLTKLRIADGIWEGDLQRDGGGVGTPPRVRVMHHDAEVPGVEVTPIADTAGHWRLRVPIPAHLLSDGVHAFVIADAETAATLGSFAVALGDPMEPDLRAEVDLLRAELDLLKRAFRRHCTETG